MIKRWQPRNYKLLTLCCTATKNKAKDQEGVRNCWGNFWLHGGILKRQLMVSDETGPVVSKYRALNRTSRGWTYVDTQHYNTYYHQGIFQNRFYCIVCWCNLDFYDETRSTIAAELLMMENPDAYRHRLDGAWKAGVPCCCSYAWKPTFLRFCHNIAM